MLLGIAASLLLFLVETALAIPTPFDTPTNNITARKYKPPKNRYRGKLSRKGQIIVGGVVGGFFGICILCVIFIVLKRTFQDWLQERMLQRRNKIERERAAEHAQVTAAGYPERFEESKLGGQPNYTRDPAHCEAAPPCQGRYGPVGCDSSLDATAVPVGREGRK